MDENKLNIKDTPVSYHGDVTISLMKGKKPYKTIHAKNNGKDEFFKILCNAVIGNNMSDVMPKYIDLIQVGLNDSETILNLIRPHYNTVNVSSGTPYSAQLVFVIPGTFLVSGTINRLKLFNSIANDAAVLADLDLGVDSIEIDTSSNLMITWVISFTN